MDHRCIKGGKQMKKAFVKNLMEMWLPECILVSQEICQLLCFPDASTILIDSCTSLENGTVLKLAGELKLGKKYELKVAEAIYPVSFRLFTATTMFEEMYQAKEEKLGVRCVGNHTYFSVWAPTAYQMDLLFCIQGEIKERWAMERTANGIWKKSFARNLHGIAYVYEISVDGETHMVVDPYTLGATINATEGVVVDVEKIAEVPHISLPLNERHQKIIYEINIRDFTIAKTADVVRKGKYAGFTDEEPLNYLQQLGVSYVQLMPLQKFFGVDEQHPKRAYNWGYNPLLYFVPEGSYSSVPEHPTERISEVKELIYRLHRKQIGVILDVVYNHVYHIETHALDQIVPGYYIRSYPDGRYIDSCGCGNDLATERTMVRKLIIESLLYWLEMFDVDGFRFDLMGNMDIQTMQEIQEALRQRKSNIFLLGEGWDLATNLSYDRKAIANHAEKLPGYAFFNDVFRDSVKGSIFDLYARGFGTGAKNQGERALRLFLGSHPIAGGKQPWVSFQQSINYIECHDNHTLFDKVTICCANESLEKRRSRQKIMTAFTLLAQGIPFVQCGQEFFRSKKGEGNTYNLGDSYNEIDWNELRANKENIQWIRTLIQLRKSHGVFGLKRPEDIERYGQVYAIWADGFAYHFKNIGHLGEARNLLIVFHFGEQHQDLDISLWRDSEVYVQMNVKNVQAAGQISQKKVSLAPLAFLVLARK